MEERKILAEELRQWFEHNIAINAGRSNVGPHEFNNAYFSGKQLIENIICELSN